MKRLFIYSILTMALSWLVAATSLFIPQGWLQDIGLSATAEFNTYIAFYGILGLVSTVAFLLSGIAAVVFFVRGWANTGKYVRRTERETSPRRAVGGIMPTGSKLLSPPVLWGALLIELMTAGEHDEG